MSFSLGQTFLHQPGLLPGTMVGYSWTLAGAWASVTWLQLITSKTRALAVQQRPTMPTYLLGCLALGCEQLHHPQALPPFALDLGATVYRP